MHKDKQKIIDDNSFPKSIKSIVRMYPSNQVNRLFYGGLPHLGNALFGSWNSPEIKDAARAYEDYSLSSNLLIDGFEPPVVDKVRLGGGSPARFKPYEKCLINMRRTLMERILSDYTLAAGDNADKVSIIEYFKHKYSLAINENNIIFTHSSTQAFSLVMRAIVDYGDVVIMTAPNYGLFSFIPERTGGRVRLLKLSKKDGWKINPHKLRQLITNIDEELETDYDMNRGKYVFRRSDIPPRVVAFLNINPHNPMGTVYGLKDKTLLLDISSACRDAGVLVVDDLAYAGLEYDRNNPALPVCTLDGHFDNTISLYSLSKSYGLASIRSGMVIANEVISSLIRDEIFQVSDSLSLLQSSAMSSVFSSDEDARREKDAYLSCITNDYHERYIFVKAFVLGTASLKEEERELFVRIVSVHKLNIDMLTTGIKDVGIVVEPESGFFVLLDLSKLLGKKYKGFKICNDRTLLQFLYTSGNIKVLPGKAFCWAGHDTLVIRITTSLDYDDLSNSLLRLKSSIELLE